MSLDPWPVVKNEQPASGVYQKGRKTPVITRSLKRKLDRERLRDLRTQRSRKGYAEVLDWETYWVGNSFLGRMRGETGIPYRLKAKAVHAPNPQMFLYPEVNSSINNGGKMQFRPKKMIGLNTNRPCMGPGDNSFALFRNLAIRKSLNEGMTQGEIDASMKFFSKIFW